MRPLDGTAPPSEESECNHDRPHASFGAGAPHGAQRCWVAEPVGEGAQGLERAARLGVAPEAAADPGPVEPPHQEPFDRIAFTRVLGPPQEGEHRLKIAELFEDLGFADEERWRLPQASRSSARSRSRSTAAGSRPSPRPGCSPR